MFTTCKAIVDVILDHSKSLLFFIKASPNIVLKDCNASLVADMDCDPKKEMNSI